MDDLCRGAGGGLGRRGRRSSEAGEGGLEVPDQPTRRRSADHAACSKIPVRSPASTPTMPRRLLSSARFSKHTQSLRSLDRDDTESLGGRSACDCEHSHFPSNGTTFSARTRRYVVHCSPQHSSSAPDEYLTPTQRANATIRKLKVELATSQAELVEREREISRLTKEIVQLRLQRLEDPDEEDEAARPSSFRPIRLCQDATLSDVPPFSSVATATHCSSSGSEVAPSLVDSGHFEELSPYNSPRTSALEKEIDRLKTEHEAEVRQMKNSTDSHIDELLKKLQDANQRCEELKPQLEGARRRLAEVEREKEELQSDVTDSDGPPFDIPSLLKQLEVTREELNNVKTMYQRLLEREPPNAEHILKFLKRAIFYFLTDRENASIHLTAIQNILGYSDEEKAAIEKKSYIWKY